MFGKGDVCLERLKGETDEWEGGGGEGNECSVRLDRKTTFTY